MGNENSTIAVKKHHTKIVEPIQKPRLVHPNVYPGIYVPALKNYRARPNGTEHYSQPPIKLVNKVPEESKQTHHHHSLHRHHHHHHRHHRHHHQQPDRNDHACQTTPSLLVEHNDSDKMQPSVPVLLKESPSSNLLNEKLNSSTVVRATTISRPVILRSPHSSLAVNSNKIAVN